MSKRRVEFDAEIAPLTLDAALSALKAYGPASRIKNPRVRKVVREARTTPSTLDGLKVSLQLAKDLSND